MKFNYNKQNITAKDISSVLKTLKSERITQGEKLKEFETLLKKYFKCKYCIVVSSGTAAQFLLAKSLNWKQNDNIILSPLTFVSGANSVLYRNSNPVFVDIKKSDQNLDPILVEKKIVELTKKKRNVKAIIVTDYGGQPADWIDFRKIANKYKVKLINDNCHAFGSKYNGDKSYAIKYTDYIIQSFHAVKNITTGEGGALLTNDKKIYQKTKQLREHGFVKKKTQLAPWNYNYAKLSIDTFYITQSISFNAIAKYTNCPVDSIITLNPVFKKQIIPVQKNKTNSFILPNSYTELFLLYKDSIYNFSFNLIEPYITEEVQVLYVVEKGDYLGKIAKKYNCTVKNLKAWNNLKSIDLSPGQKLIVYNPVVSKKKKDKKYEIYKVQVGDTLWDIAEKNEGITIEDIVNANNLKNLDIYPGLKLKIPIK